MAVDWSLIRRGCPRCECRLQWHSLSVWCLRCGWGKNWQADQPIDLLQILRGFRGET